MLGGLKKALRSPSLVRVFALGQLCHPKLVELVAHLGGYDGLWLDQEHCGLTVGQIEEAARAGRAAGIDCFVRMPVTDYASTMRVLEAGACGIMASMVRSLDEARNLVRWAMFHPLGERGINGTGADGRYGLHPFPDYFRHANDSTVLGVQVEHADAVACVEGLAALPGLDFLFVGPADLSQSLGVAGQWDHPKLWEAIERVASACAKASMPWAVLPLGPAFTARAKALGCRMF
ncbi:MAG: hypothetical protein K2W96_02170, partial [Gemmataceae bacterium]|nr:hypothetical protein [Gemmataceae bacterium]